MSEIGRERSDKSGRLDKIKEWEREKKKRK